MKTTRYFVHIGSRDVDAEEAMAKVMGVAKKQIEVDESRIPRIAVPQIGRGIIISTSIDGIVESRQDVEDTPTKKQPVYAVTVSHVGYVDKQGFMTVEQYQKWEEVSQVVATAIKDSVEKFGIEDNEE